MQRETAWKGRRSGELRGKATQAGAVRGIWVAYSNSCAQPWCSTVHGTSWCAVGATSCCPLPSLQDVPARADLLLAGPALPVRIHSAGKGWRPGLVGGQGRAAAASSAVAPVPPPSPRPPSYPPRPSTRRRCGCWAARGCCWALWWRSACCTCWTSCDGCHPLVWCTGQTAGTSRPDPLTASQACQASCLAANCFQLTLASNLGPVLKPSPCDTFAFQQSSSTSTAAAKHCSLAQQRTCA